MLKDNKWLLTKPDKEAFVRHPQLLLEEKQCVQV